MTEVNGFAIEDDGPIPDLHTLAPEHFTSLKRSLSRATELSKLEQIPQSGFLHDDSKDHRKAPLGETLSINIPALPPSTEIALTALQYLPTPILVLSSLKTIVLANEAMGRLLGLSQNIDDWENVNETVTDILRGQTLSQIGIDMISDGVPVWVSWEKFLDTLAPMKGPQPEYDENGKLHDIQSGETTPQAVPEQSPTFDEQSSRRSQSPSRDRALVHDTAVDVIVSPQHIRHYPRYSLPKPHKPHSPGIQTSCRMIISIWTLENQRYFSLSFTSPNKQQFHSSHSHSHVVHRATSGASTRSSHSRTPTSSTSSSVVQSPSETNATSFPPTGAPSKCPPPSTYTEFQKITRMKDAMLQAMHIPVLAMWKDESVVFPNPAARKLLAVSTDPTSDESYDFMSRFKPWAADFSRQLDEVDNPIISLCRTQKQFNRWQIGLINERTGKRSNFDVSGHPVFDDKTGEFFAGLIAFKDVTEYAEIIATQTAENEEQFKVICDMMPQMLWTTRPDGYHDYFSQRWYDYTGLNPSNSLGLGWKLPFHEEDMPETAKRWAHSLATGEEYLTEYRCRRHDGEWRWMLGRALPLREQKTGKILKWFGTCTDIQDIMDARNTAARARQQLLDVLQHSQMYMWIVDRNECVTFFEGHAVEGVTPDQLKQNFVGLSVYDSLKEDSDPRFISDVRAAIQRILSGKTSLELFENEINGRWVRSRMVPLRGKVGANGVVDENYIAGVIGIGTEVTEVRRREQENIKLLANESAAKEASKMKSNFLANMSHEIRTPIAGVLGMSELLMDTDLDTEQLEFAQNIQRSANSLLTVINDILDFSKIESGRLDIEEVQFSLTVVLKDVAKMLSYAAQRKNLDFKCDLQLGGTSDLILLGDPGRIRQILTNLLTNSIKFTSDGHVNLMAKILSDTNETTTVEFSVEDSGIGIEEVVKQRLFKPFSQADSSTARRFGGTGLGLTISKNLVDLMHGTIRLDSKLDSGTTATFTIPFKKPEFVAGSSTPLVEVGALPDRLQSELSISCNTSSTAEASPATRASPPVPSPRSITSMKVQRSSVAPSGTDSPGPQELLREQHHILVVEDNAVNQQIAIKFIKSLKFSVSAVWNGREALEYLLKATSPNLTLEEARDCKVPSLILMDVQMPILDGYHATHLLRHHAPYTQIQAVQNIPIVAMTASAIQGDREKCERAGMDDYLAKPVKKSVLEKMIVKWIRSGEHQRRGSLTPSENVKPLLTRSPTDHSANCPDYDVIATQFISSRGAAAATDPAPMNDPTPRGSPRNIHSDDVRRSSLTHSLLSNGMPEVESEAESTMRRVEDEERASSLRDAKLLSATEDDPMSGLSLADTRNPNRIVDYTIPNSLDSTTLSDSTISKVSSLPLALTEANVERLNSQESGSSELGRLIITPPAEIQTISDILLRTPAERVMTGTSRPPMRKEPSNPVGQKTRFDVGGLQPGQRSRSDLSSSTAKP